MKLKLLCRDDEKCPAEIKPYMIEIDEEAVMDGNNIATVFCPHCNREMKSQERPYSGNAHR
jgi:hypothetical protein